MRRVVVDELMKTSGVSFGTSGARGLVAGMTDELCVTYTLAFAQYLSASGQLEKGAALSLGGDRRPSTPRILKALAAAARHLGLAVDYQGLLPSPALVLHGMSLRRPTIMVTGSHIPADRNGLKFTTASGEIDKRDEQGIREQVVSVPDWFDEMGQFRTPAASLSPSSEAIEAYERRFARAFPENCLSKVRLGVFGHSAVGRDFMMDLYGRMGADVVALGFSDQFVPVDTEAIRPEDVSSAKAWASRLELDAIVSTDGDSDRPLIADETGTWFRGDIAGIHTARFLKADAVATAVSCNTALERSEFFRRTLRTRIGSPYVIAGMNALADEGAQAVVGYEANGGFLQHSELSVPGGGRLAPLPTRDPIIVHLALLFSARQAGLPLSRLNDVLPTRVTASGRDQTFATERSSALLQRLRDAEQNELSTLMGLGSIQSIDNLDGMRISFLSGEILHLRPSGNAPELRCYAESQSAANASKLVSYGLSKARELSS